MAQRWIWALAVVCAVIIVSGCGHPYQDLKTEKGETYLKSSVKGGYTLLFSPDTRGRNAEAFFADEFAIIDKTQQQTGARAVRAVPGASEGPARIGLGLSGGGLRSNAFQLGLLSALQEARGPRYSSTDQTGNTALDNIAYLSSVSGGTWAAAAMLAYRTGNTGGDHLEDFFEGLNKTAVEDRSRARGSSGAPTKSADSTDNAARILNNSYGAALESLNKVYWSSAALSLTAGYTARESWRDLLLGSSLLGKDKKLSDLMAPSGVAAEAGGTSKAAVNAVGPGRGKPYWIINATHSAEGPGNTKNHFNFQITPHGVGTLADCGNTHYCGFTRNYGGFYKPFDEAGAYNKFPHIMTSHAMAISGAVLPQKILGMRLGMLEWNFPMPKPDRELLKSVQALTDETDKPLREAYVLTDGGHSENYGALALMERNVDVLIISDASYDGGYTFEDYKSLKHHADTLLGVTFAVNATGTNPKQWYRRTQPQLLHFDPNVKRYGPGTEVAEAVQKDLLVYTDKSTESNASTINAGAYLGEYCYKPKDESKKKDSDQQCDSQKAKQVIYLRPPYRLEEFNRYLLDRDNAVVITRNTKNIKKYTEAKSDLLAAQAAMARYAGESCLSLVLPGKQDEKGLLGTDEKDGQQAGTTAEQEAIAAKLSVLEGLRPPESAKLKGEVMQYETDQGEAIRGALKALADASRGVGNRLEKYETCDMVRKQKYQEAALLREMAQQKLHNMYEAEQQGKAPPTTGYMATYHYLNLNRTHFPRDKTMVTSYDRELIFAYYLLGKFMGEEKLLPLLNEYLDAIPKQ